MHSVLFFSFINNNNNKMKIISEHIVNIVEIKITV